MTEIEHSRVVRAQVNGHDVARTVPARLTLAELLRDEIGLTGTKLSCEMQICGACTVLVNGLPTSSCMALAADADGAQLQTVEGLAGPAGLHPLQKAFVECFALQCGYCTPGMLMAAAALLEENPDPSREAVVEALDGNLCRCTGYEPIVEAVLQAAAKQAETAGVAEAADE